MTFALEYIHDQVKAWFDARSLQVEHTFGFDAPERYQENVYARVAWVPGDPVGVMCGSELTMHGNPALEGEEVFAVIPERFHLVVSAFDPAEETDRWRQWSAVRSLHDLVRNAISDIEAPVSIDRVDWLQKSKQFGHGLALRLSCTVESLLVACDTNGETLIFPWSAITRVHVDEQLIETIESPPEN